jgi:hypothetical protein
MVVTIAMVSNWFVVVPKIRRVLSGEKVVISNMLWQMNPIGLSPQSGVDAFVNGVYTGSPNVVIGGVKMGSPNADAATDNARPAKGEAEQVVMTEDDPLPQCVETELYRLQEVINSLKIDR